MIQAIILPFEPYNLLQCLRVKYLELVSLREQLEQMDVLVDYLELIILGVEMQAYLRKEVDRILNLVYLP
jgi:hypothetical protein